MTGSPERPVMADRANLPESYRIVARRDSWQVTPDDLRSCPRVAQELSNSCRAEPRKPRIARSDVELVVARGPGGACREEVAQVRRMLELGSASKVVDDLSVQACCTVTGGAGQQWLVVALMASRKFVLSLARLQGPRRWAHT